MSIFPKRIKANENLIIHFKTQNIEKPKFIQYLIEIIDDNGKVVKNYYKEEISNSVHETYFVFTPDDSFAAGKYYVRSRVYIEGRIIESFSSIKDYFYIDKIDIRIRKNEEQTIELINTSTSTTPVLILNKAGNIVEQGELDAKEVRKILFDKDLVYIKYANSDIEKILVEEEIYAKSKEIRWRIRNGHVEVLDEKTFNLYTLSTIETLVWMNVDGVNSLDDIKNNLNKENQRDIQAILNKFEKDNLIRRI